MQRRLQPYVVEAAALCGGGCNPMWWRLQPYASSREGRPSTCTPAGSPAVPCSAAAASASHDSAPLASAAGYTSTALGLGVRVRVRG